MWLWEGQGGEAVGNDPSRRGGPGGGGHGEDTFPMEGALQRQRNGVLWFGCGLSHRGSCIGGLVLSVAMLGGDEPLRGGSWGWGQG